MSPLSHPPRIVVTLMVAAAQAEPEIAERKNALYVDSVVRHGAIAIPLDATSSPAEREAAFASMDGLLISGGADLDPARYGQPNQGSRDLEPDRDELEAGAWAAAEARGVPVLGICRGLQAMNAFAGGALLQDVGGHVGNGWGHGPAATHSIHLVPGSATARILDPSGSGADIIVNSYHHQAVRTVDLAPAFTATAFADSPAGPLVEALETASGPWRMAVQCHPERTESTPAAFERLFAAFVEACHPARRRSSAPGPRADPEDGRTTFELLNPDGLHRPANYSQLGIVTGGRLVFVAGQLGLDASGRLAGDDFASQARQAFANVAIALAAAGATPSDVIKLVTYVVDHSPDKLSAAREARVAVFGTHLPTSVFLGVEALAMPEYLVEVEAIAVVR